MPRPKPVDWLVLAGLVLAWGSAFGALKIAVHEIPPIWNTVGRLWIASVTLAVVCAVNGERPPKLSDPAWRYYGFNGLIGMAAPFFLFAFAAEGCRPRSTPSAMALRRSSRRSLPTRCSGTSGWARGGSSGS